MPMANWIWSCTDYHPPVKPSLSQVVTPVPSCYHPAGEVLLPLYFASSGIKTNIGTLDKAEYWGITLAIICIASLAKFVPATLVSKLVTRRKWKFCVTMGILMNTRGLVEVIALNIGLNMVSGTQASDNKLCWIFYSKKNTSAGQSHNDNVCIQSNHAHSGCKQNCQAMQTNCVLCMLWFVFAMDLCSLQQYGDTV